MNLAALTAAIVMAGLWPFAGGDKKDDEATLKSLEKREIEIDAEEGGVPGSADLAMESYRAYLELGTADDPALVATALRRLADLTLEAGEAREEMTADLVALQQADLAEAASLYRRLLAEHGNFAGRDLVLYQLARALETGGNTEEALAVLDDLVVNHPATPYLIEGQFRRGEMLFSQRAWFDAQESYEAVIAAGDSGRYYEQSLYKHGWTLFKQGEYEASLGSFFAILDRHLVADEEGMLRVDIPSMPRAKREMLSDTLRVMSIGFSYMEGADSVDAFLATRAGATPYAHLVYTRLGDLYIDKERYTDAADAYHAFVKREPNHSQAPLLQVEAIEAYKKAGFPSRVLKAKEEYVVLYGPDSSFWDTRTRDDVPMVVSYLKSNVAELARHYHSVAQKEKTQDDYRTAARWYRLYLDAFPDVPEAPENSFLLAEILFESGDFEAAARQYEVTAYDYPAHERSAEAGYATILAYKRRGEELNAGADAEAAAAWKRAGIDAGLRFAAAFPDHEQAISVQTDAAEGLFAAGELDRAIAAATVITDRDPAPEPEYLRTAWRVRAHSRFDLLQFAEAEAAYLQLETLLAADDEKRGEVRERIAASIYRQAEIADDAGDLEMAAFHYLRVRNAVPESQYVLTADYDGVAALIRLESWDRAIEEIRLFRERHPDSEYDEDITLKLASAYTESGDTAGAADEFRRISNLEGQDMELRRASLWRSAELYGESGQGDTAVAVWIEYVERFPEPFDAAMDARNRLAEHYRDEGDITTWHRWLNKIIAADAAAGEARTARSQTLAARASIELAGPAREAFYAVKLTAPLDKSLKRKKTHMEAALKAYGKAVDYQIADVTTRATFEIAEIYNVFSQDLFDSERPTELAPDELEQYEILLEEQAFPFEEQAIEIHQANAARAADGVYDEWVRKSFDSLAELLPVRYAKAEVGEDIVNVIR